MCYGSDVCAGTKWDDVESEAQASNTISMILDVLALLLMIATLVLTLKKHAAISKLWKVLAVFPALWLLNPIVQAAVSAPAQTIRFTGITVRSSLPFSCPPALHLYAPPASTYLYLTLSPSPRPVLRNGRHRQGVQ